MATHKFFGGRLLRTFERFARILLYFADSVEASRAVVRKYFAHVIRHYINEAPSICDPLEPPAARYVHRLRNRQFQLPSTRLNV